MATVKILYDDNASAIEKYLKEKMEHEGPTTEHGCNLADLKEQFSVVQSMKQSKGNNAIHIIQSWHPTESQKLSREQIHAMGTAMAERFAPGHQFVVQTHTEEPHAHNHIVINPVSIETGKRIHNKLENIRTLRNINDDIARENGLSVLPSQEKLRKPGMNEVSKRIEAYRGRSYLFDLASKADFARSNATNYDEYVSLLNSFDVQVRIEPKNITYFYPGREHGKRGKNLAPRLDKPELEKTFVLNQERLEKSRNGSSIQVKPEIGVKVPDLVSTRAEGVTTPRSEELQKSLIPIQEIQKAKAQSILRYCEKSGIKLNQNESGLNVLAGREYVEVSDHQWINHRNKTRGNIIDFVSTHKQVGYLQAIAQINANPRLLLLESLSESKQPRFQSFYIPKEDSATREDSIKSLAQLLGHPSTHRVYDDLLRQQVAHVNRAGVVSFFSEKNPTGYLEFTPTENGRYNLSKHGSLHAPFFSRKAQSGTLKVSLDPVETLQRNPDAFIHAKNGRDGALMLFEANLDAVRKAVAEQRNIKRVVLMSSTEQSGVQSAPIIQFFKELKESLDPFSIETELLWESSNKKDITRSRDTDFGMSREL